MYPIPNVLGGLTYTHAESDVYAEERRGPGEEGVYAASTTPNGLRVPIRPFRPQCDSSPSPRRASPPAPLYNGACTTR